MFVVYSENTTVAESSALLNQDDAKALVEQVT